MKKEKKDTVLNTETPAAPKAPAKPRKDKKKPKPKPKQTDAVRLPVLVELTYALSTILLVFVGLAMMITSFLNGATLLNLVLRTSVALLVIGSLLVFISSQVSSGVLQASLVEQEQAQMSQPPQPDEADKPSNPVILENPAIPENPAILENQEMPEAS